MSEMSEYWKDWQEFFRARRAENRDFNTNLIKEVCARLDVYCDTKDPYRFRLSKQDFYSVDVFPTSGKAHPIGRPHRFLKPRDLCEFIVSYFNDVQNMSVPLPYPAEDGLENDGLLLKPNEIESFFDEFLNDTDK